MASSCQRVSAVNRLLTWMNKDKMRGCPCKHNQSRM